MVEVFIRGVYLLCVVARHPSRPSLKKERGRMDRAQDGEQGHPGSVPDTHLLWDFEFSLPCLAVPVRAARASQLELASLARLYKLT